MGKLTPQEIADRTSDFFKLGFYPLVDIKPIKRGKCRKKTKCISIPEWVFKYEYPFLIYYVAHEIIHFVVWKHDKKFKELEQSVLKTWGIEIEYNRAYPKTLRYKGKTINLKP